MRACGHALDRRDARARRAHAPDAIAVTLDDDAITFGALDTDANRIANGLADTGVGRGDRVLWWGDTSLEAVPVFGALAKIGAVFAPLNARASVDERGPSPSTPALACSSRRPDTARRPPNSPQRRESRSSRTFRSAPSRRLGIPSSTNATRTSSSSRAGAPGRPKGVVLSHRANWLRTYPGATTTTGGAGTVCMFPLFHMAGWTIALGAWQGRRPMHFVRIPDAETLCARRPGIARRGCTASPRSGRASWNIRRPGPNSRPSSRPTPVRRRHHRSCCTRSRTRCRGPSRACSTDRPRRDPACNSATTTCCASPGAVGVPQAGCRR